MRFYRLIKTKAFTLIELLVVVLIIAVIAIMLFPAWNTSLKYSQKAKCMGTVKTVTAAYLGSIADNNGSFPYHGKVGAVNYLALLVPNYLATEPFCSLRSRAVTNPARGFRYSINDNLRKYFPSPAAVPCAPTRTVLVSEMYIMWEGFSSWSHLRDTVMSTPQTGGIPQNHFGGLNLGFLDGHVEWVKPPTDGAGQVNWVASPTYGRNYQEGLYFHEGQFYLMSIGKTSW